MSSYRYLRYTRLYGFWRKLGVRYDKKSVFFANGGSMKTSNSIYIDNHWKQKDAYIFDESTHINNGFQGAIAFIWMDFYFIWFSPSPLYYCACNNLNWNRFVFFFYHYFYFFLFFRYIWHKHLAHETVQQGILTNLYSLNHFAYINGKWIKTRIGRKERIMVYLSVFRYTSAKLGKDSSARRPYSDLFIQWTL